MPSFRAPILPAPLTPACPRRSTAASPPTRSSPKPSLDTDARAHFGAAFHALTAQQKIDLLTPRVEDPFFRTMKDMTVDAYYTSREGLAEELGWHGNTFLPEFKGCTHPEHQH
jgi:Gluconate 2-dehydrogenase subunit 3